MSGFNNFTSTTFFVVLLVSCSFVLRCSSQSNEYTVFDTSGNLAVGLKVEAINGQYSDTYLVNGRAALSVTGHNDFNVFSIISYPNGFDLKRWKYLEFYLYIENSLNVQNTSIRMFFDSSLGNLPADSKMVTITDNSNYLVGNITQDYQLVRVLMSDLNFGGVDSVTRICFNSRPTEWWYNIANATLLSSPSSTLGPSGHDPSNPNKPSVNNATYTSLSCLYIISTLILSIILI
ncbi:hypothetical protein PPL_02728 [Heterostelium album PN500]|uniref:Uncharacterized protein n=1 Tax=Heterostelium pallidum (strain ATCC 26659 / Pp 5 / PN500) TaxID=670386 RepID=D3B2W4_HETP5|nr:hypothetical protein PPL_02728 [Heterostelium album PN500]EFA83662.1 hypothetical protein PPL_02728 [Heterostelium album PN500]|eukprot:XP_020435779.1 hypothetical protein PPL_02728 [Heterostelium album PN500]